jgi:hypothetical protein
MEPRPELLPFYLELIDSYGDQGQPVLRDYFVLLAADAYLASGQEDEAETLYTEFSANNPDHVLAGHASLAAAVNDPEADGYLASLRQNYPEDVVRDLVQEARTRRKMPIERRVPDPDPEPTVVPTAIPVTQQLPIIRQQNNPPNRGPGNPVPAPRPQPTAPPRRDPVPQPAPVPVRPQPATVPRPAPSTPGRAREPAPSTPPAGEEEGLPFVNFLLLIVLLGAGVYLAGWTLARPFFH